jgi:pyruvate formate lyase activating enzyme
MTASTLQCPVCFRHCALADGQTGFCAARKRQDGAIVPLNDGAVTALALDPIEKKPLARFHPGSRILSVGSFGCNLTCPFCQNHAISRLDAAGFEDLAAVGRGLHLTPERLCQLADQSRDQGNIGLAFTYNEPTLCPEFVVETSRLIHRAGLVTVLVTNGSAAPDVWDDLMRHIDAANIDLKAFRPDLYRRLGGELDIVKRNIAAALRAGVHVEVTSLIVPGFNDDEADLIDQAQWLASLNPDLPLHLSRFFPRYRLTDRPPTDVALVYRLVQVASHYLNHVYTGNC